jgi:hypothetical protein
VVLWSPLVALCHQVLLQLPSQLIVLAHVPLSPLLDARENKLLDVFLELINIVVFREFGAHACAVFGVLNRPGHRPLFLLALDEAVNILLKGWFFGVVNPTATLLENGVVLFSENLFFLFGLLK